MNENQNIENQVDEIEENKIEDSIPTEFTSRDFLDSLLDGKNIEAGEMFSQMISDRVASALGDFQEDVAESMFIEEGYTVKKVKTEKHDGDEDSESSIVKHYSIVHNKTGKKIGRVVDDNFGLTMHIVGKDGMERTYEPGPVGNVQSAVNRALKNKKIKDRLKVEY